MLKGEENRRFVRVLLDIPCKFSLQDNLKEKIEGKIIDLSISGISLETEKEISVGENLNFYLSLSEGLNCEFVGQITRKVKDNEYAIKIVEIKESARNKLGDFIINYLEEQNRIIKLFMQVKRSEK